MAILRDRVVSQLPTFAMNCLIILAGLVTMAYATGLGGPETVDFASVPISKDIIAKAKELGKTTNVVVKQYTVNYATR